jgi:hypothetical protein
VDRALQQVRPPHRADEDEVAGKDAHRPVRRGGVGDHEAQVLGGVTRRVHHLHAHVADREGVAVAQQGGAVLRRVRVLPLRAALAAEQQPRAGSRGQLARARDEVGVDVRLGDVRHAQPLALRGLHVLCDVAAGIDDERLARGRAPHQVAGLRQRIVVEALQEHRRVRVVYPSRPSADAATAARVRRERYFMDGARAIMPAQRIVSRGAAEKRSKAHYGAEIRSISSMRLPKGSAT